MKTSTQKENYAGQREATHDYLKEKADETIMLSLYLVLRNCSMDGSLHVRGALHGRGRDTELVSAVSKKKILNSKNNNNNKNTHKALIS